ncbi:atp-binding cassette transporter [Trichoderma arundinaceum]|uniref:Atp-binding cassette transporter n=1 Tax=Trichoderma arundinaceum TaxID=490622 RepID=A0A395NUF9_TRIAR|nr:atp-binding cassette transporter [Trichoderma arundinaceum]
MLTLSWLIPLMRKGFNSTLSLESLFHLRPEMGSRSLLENLSSRWSDTDQRKPLALFYTILAQHKYTIFAGVFFRSGLTALSFCQPFLVQAELEYTGQSQSGSSAKGTWLLVGYAGVYIGIALCQAGYQYHTRKFIVEARGSAVSILYRHMLRADLTKASPEAPPPISLMSVDMEKIAFGLITAHQVWASLIEIGLFIWVLQRQIHLAVLASALTSLLCLVGGSLISIQAKGHLTAWLEDTQRRIDMTESVLTRFKPVALAGFMDAVSSRISALRATEIQTSKRYRSAIVGVLTISYSSMVIPPVIGFGLFVFVPSIRGSHTFNDELAFSTLTAFTLFSKAITSFIQAALGLMSALGGFERYQQAIREPQFIDPRLHNSELPLPLMVTSPKVVAKGDRNSIALQSLHRRSVLTYEGVCVVIRDANIGWPGNTEVISGASLSIRSQRITAITGGSGSGKTTLLEAFLGQAMVSEGTLSTTFIRAAYCSQTPWICDGSIMDNIVNCSIFNRSRYDAVMAACGLRQDIARMPLRDMTQIGSGGSRLSGGQRKRVHQALARAVYSELDVLILDDTLSGLDPETSNAVWQNLCGVNGFLRREGRTVIFSSMHNSAVAVADDIFDIVGGKISRRPQDFSPTVRNSLDLSLSTINTTPATSEPNVDFDIHPQEIHEMEEPNQVGEQVEGKKRLGEWQAYVYYTAAIGRRNTALLIFICLAIVLGLQLPQIWIGLWTQANELQRGLSSGAYYGVYVAFGGFALLFLTIGGLSAHILHRALLETTLKASIVHIINQSIGSVLNRFSQDLAIIDTEVPLASFNTVFFLLSCMVQAVFVCVSSKYMSAGIVVFLAMFYIIQKFYLRTSRQLRVLDIEAKAPLISHFSDTIAGLKTIRAGGWATQFEANALDILDQSQRPFYLLYSVQVWLGLALDLLVAAVAIILVGISNSFQGSATAGFLGVAVSSLVSFGVNLNELIVAWTYVETAVQAVLRIRDYVRDTPVEDDSNYTANPPLSWPEAGRIEFKNVCASYGEDAGLVLDNLSFVIEAGQTIGVCGRSGSRLTKSPTRSGKSSLLATLYRLLELNDGSIFIDGFDIRQMTRQRLRSKLLNIPQDAFLIPGTLRYNLDPWGVKLDSELIAALKVVKLWDALEKAGLDAEVGKNTFSSGQMQCLSLARALIRGGNIVIVDELTSNLDAESAAIARAVLREHFRLHTVVIVTHRLDDLLECDQALVLEEGRVVEYDTPQVLLGIENSKFRKIIASS